ncbi:MAG TPA: PKD domain protein, partial [Flavobacterium sp.]
MKKIKFIFSFVLLLAVTVSCTVEGIGNDTALLGTDSSANLNKIFDISTDNSGKVKITPTADGATSFQVVYGQGTGAPATVAPGSSATHIYPEGKYTVKIIATS